MSNIFIKYILLNKKISGVLIILLILIGNSYSQQAHIYGIITDSVTNESLPGVNVILSNGGGVSSNSNGYYYLDLERGQHAITFSFLGYKTKTISLNLKDSDSINLNVSLANTSFLLDMAVVSAGKYEQKISDVTVSIEVMKPSFSQNINTTNMEDALQYVPGLDILDGQASIRGGGGYSYGAGSRVMVLIDDIPNNWWGKHISTRPWNKKNNPKSAVKDFILKNNRFKIDHTIDNKILLTVAPSGFLKCTKN